MSLFLPKESWINPAYEWIHTESSCLSRDVINEKCMIDVNGTNLLKILREPRLRTGDISQDHSRMFVYWKERGVFPTVLNDRKWVKLSVLDTAWCQIVDELLKFNLPYEKIKRVKECIFDEAMYGDDGITPHEYGFMKTIFDKESKTYLGIFPDGTADILSEADILLTQENTPSISMLQINLNALYMSHSQHGGYFSSQTCVKSLKSEEQAIVDAIRDADKGINSVNIKMKNGKPTLLSKEQHLDIKTDELNLAELKKKHPHMCMTLHTNPAGKYNATIVSKEKI